MTRRSESRVLRPGRAPCASAGPNRGGERLTSTRLPLVRAIRDRNSARIFPKNGMVSAGEENVWHRRSRLLVSRLQSREVAQPLLIRASSTQVALIFLRAPTQFRISAKPDKPRSKWQKGHFTTNSRSSPRSTSRLPCPYGTSRDSMRGCGDSCARMSGERYWNPTKEPLGTFSGFC